MLATTGDNGEPMGSPSVSTNSFSLNVNTVDHRQSEHSYIRSDGESCVCCVSFVSLPNFCWNINEAIQLKVESKNENGELPFLDYLIKRNLDGKRDTTVYRKPTNTCRYLNFHSCHSSATKQGFIKGLFLGAERLC